MSTDPDTASNPSRGLLARLEDVHERIERVLDDAADLAPRRRPERWPALRDDLARSLEAARGTAREALGSTALHWPLLDPRSPDHEREVDRLLSRLDDDPADESRRWLEQLDDLRRLLTASFAAVESSADGENAPPNG